MIISSLWVYVNRVVLTYHSPEDGAVDQFRFVVPIVEIVIQVMTCKKRILLSLLPSLRIEPVLVKKKE